MNSLWISTWLPGSIVQIKGLFVFCFDEHTLHYQVKWNLEKFFSSSLTKKNICQSFFFLSGCVHTTADSISCRLEKLSGISVNTYPRFMTLQFRDRRSLASLRNQRHGYRGEITVLMCKKRAYPVWFSCRRKSHPVECKDSLPCRDKDCSGKLILPFSSTTTMFP